MILCFSVETYIKKIIANEITILRRKLAVRLFSMIVQSDMASVLIKRLQNGETSDINADQEDFDTVTLPGPMGRRVHSLNRSCAGDEPGLNLPELPVFTSAFLLPSDKPGVLVQ